MQRDRAELEETLRLRDDFLAVAGHEMKTPLTALQLQLEGVARAVRQRRPGFEALADERLTKALGHLERLQALIASLLDASRLEVRPTLLREPLDFAAVVSAVVERLSATAARVGSPIHLAHDGPLPGRFDRGQLETLTTHLVTSAVKYGMGKPIEVELRRDAGAALLRVRDDGLALEGTDAAHVFERCARAAPDERYGGLGLGLWVVRRIVDAAGGTVEVARGRAGRGATFTVRLPLQPAGLAP